MPYLKQKRETKSQSKVC